MKITVIHGQSHRGVTYKMSNTVLKHLAIETDEIKEFFLPIDGPDFCCGCFNCFLKGESFCPSADKVEPIAKALEWADVIILDSPNYVMEMSGALKNMMDHLAYRWITHRPHGTMFTKLGIVVSSSAGAPPIGTVKSMAKQLRWMGVPKVYRMGVVSFAGPGEQLKPKKVIEIEQKAKKIAGAVKKRIVRRRTGLREKVEFMIFRKMQSSSEPTWNPTDQDWWVDQGWTGDVRPWKF